MKELKYDGKKISLRTKDAEIRMKKKSPASFAVIVMNRTKLLH